MRTFAMPSAAVLRLLSDLRAIKQEPPGVSYRRVVSVVYTNHFWSCATVLSCPSLSDTFVFKSSQPFFGTELLQRIRLCCCASTRAKSSEKMDCLLFKNPPRFDDEHYTRRTD